MTEQEWLTSGDPQQMLDFLVYRSHSDMPWFKTPSERKLRLFACACCRQVWHLLTDDAPCGKCAGRGYIRVDECGEYGHDIRREDCPSCTGTGRINRSRSRRRAVEVAEKYTDGLATEAEFTAAQNDIDLVGTIENSPERHAYLLARQSLLGMPPRYDMNRLSAGLGVDFCPVLRHIVGNPFRPPWSRVCQRCDGKGELYIPVLHRGPGPEPDIKYVMEPPQGAIPCYECSGRGWLPPDKCPTCKDNDRRLCRRSACRSPGADHWHTMNEEWYCGVCARKINETNPGLVVKCPPCHGKGILTPAFPSHVIALAESLYAGDQGVAGPLHDALLEAGHVELANHFRESKHGDQKEKTKDVSTPRALQKTTGVKEVQEAIAAAHPHGCWAVDLILGKE